MLENAGLDWKTLGLSTRVANVLQRNKIFTLVDLLTYKKADLMALPKFGKTSMKDVSEMLENAGLTWKADPIFF